MATVCPACSCTLATPDSLAAHALLAALSVDDLDRALASGLLDGRGCTGCNDACNDACNAQIIDARDARLRALAARDRYRARSARLLQRAAERAPKRALVLPSTSTADSLPPAAAAALERAIAKAAERGPR